MSSDDEPVEFPHPSEKGKAASVSTLRQRGAAKAKKHGPTDYAKWDKFDYEAEGVRDDVIEEEPSRAKRALEVQAELDASRARVKELEARRDAAQKRLDEVKATTWFWQKIIFGVFILSFVCIVSASYYTYSAYRYPRYKSSYQPPPVDADPYGYHDPGTAEYA